MRQQKRPDFPRGISEALNCTAFGLLVAIIAIVGFAVFQTLVSRIITEMTESSMNFMNVVVSNRDKIERQHKSLGGISMAHIEESGKNSSVVELNLVPFIDLMSVCIIFLLITAVWTQVSMIQLGSSIYSNKTDDKPIIPPPFAEVVLRVGCFA